MTWTAETLRRELRAELAERMRARDKAATRTLRLALAAIDNAEAAPAPDAARAGAWQASPTGVGATEVDRLELTHATLHALLAAEHETADCAVLARWL